jgi:HAD superfamily hydrolase (TIGR01509 family)
VISNGAPPKRTVCGLRSVSAVLTDFDGTLAQLFVGVRLGELTATLCDFYSAHGISLDGLCEDPNDPYSLWAAAYLRMAETLDVPLAEKINKGASAVLTKHEFRAAKNAVLFPGVEATLGSLKAQGHCIAIVSSNSTQAIQKALNARAVLDTVDVIFGRNDDLAMSKLKPSPALIHEALEDLETPATSAIFVGDRVEDVTAGRSAGVRTIGVLTGRASASELEDCGADVILESFRYLSQLAVGSAE